MKFQELENGVMEYINTEFCSRLEDWRKWLLPIAAGYAMPYMEKKYLDNLEMLKTVGVVDQDGNIDIDTLYTKTLEVARKTGNMRWDVPMLGPVVFGSEDVDKLYRILRRS